MHKEECNDLVSTTVVTTTVQTSRSNLTESLSQRRRPASSQQQPAVVTEKVREESWSSQPTFAFSVLVPTSTNSHPVDNLLATFILRSKPANKLRGV